MTMLRRVAALALLAVLPVTACDGDAEPGSGGPLAGAQSALSTAEEEIFGVAREIEYDDGRWVVGVVVDDRQTDITVSEDGAEVIDVGAAEDLDSDDVDEFSEVQISVYEALRAASEQTPGTIAEASISTHQDAVAFEVDLVRDAGGSATVYVDAVTGEVLD